MKSVLIVIYCTALCVHPFLAVVTMDCFVVIKDVPVANALSYSPGFAMYNVPSI